MSNSIFTEGATLARSKQWSPYMKAISEGYRRTHNGKAIEPNILSTTAILLENTRNYMARMDETTKAVNLGNFVDYGFGIISAVMPSLVANEIVSVQPLKARTGEVFYMDFKYGTTKSGAEKGDVMIGAFTGAAGNFDYASQNNRDEVLGSLATGETDGNFTLSYLPVIPGKVTVTDGTNEWKDTPNADGKTGTLAGTGLASGTINYETGAVTVTLASGAGTDTSIMATYDFDFRSNDVNALIPEVDLDLKSIQLVTTTKKLRARWLFDVAYELQQTHGVDADAELSAALAGEVRHEIDGEILRDLYVTAQAGSVEFSWSKTPAAGVAYVDHKDTFVDKVIEMSNAIFADTKRGEGNFIVGGINVCSLIESLGGRFVPTTTGQKSGPHISGILDGRWKVVKNPYYDPNQFVVGYKGDSYLEGGYVYAPYLPLYTTPTVMLDDFVNRKGVLTTYAKKALNPRFYAKGKITV